MDNKIKEYLKQIGKKGGQTTALKHPEHLKSWAKKAAQIRWKK